MKSAHLDAVRRLPAAAVLLLPVAAIVVLLLPPVLIVLAILFLLFLLIRLLCPVCALLFLHQLLPLLRHLQFPSRPVPVLLLQLSLVLRWFH